MKAPLSKQPKSETNKKDIPKSLIGIKFLLTAKTSGYVLLPLVLLVLPADYFDQGQSLCLSKVLAGVECFGCGMTRAIMHLIHLEFQVAAGFNKLCFVVFPVLSVLWAQWFWQDYKRLQQLHRQAFPPQG